MNGTIPQSIGKLSMLVSLRLGSNSWEGVLTEAHFQNLTRLKSLLLTPKFYAKWTLVLDVKQDWVPPFKLRYIGLANVQIGPNFPAWLKTQNELKFLLLNNAGISTPFRMAFGSTAQMSPIGVYLITIFTGRYHTFNFILRHIILI
jgi:hypothetical protein